MKMEQSIGVDRGTGAGVRVEVAAGGNATFAPKTEIVSTATTALSSPSALESAEKDEYYADGCNDHNTPMAFAQKESTQKGNRISTFSRDNSVEIHAPSHEAEAQTHEGKGKQTTIHPKKEFLELLSRPSIIEGMTVGQVINVVRWRRRVRRDKILRQIKRKKPKDAPKRPLSGYNVFFKEERRRILDADEPDMDFRSIAKTVGGRWRALSDEAKSRYKVMAAPDMDRYRLEMKEYREKNAGKPQPEVTKKQIRAMIKKNKKKERENWSKAKRSAFSTGSRTILVQSVLAAATSAGSRTTSDVHENSAGSELEVRWGGQRTEQSKSSNEHDCFD